MKLLSKLAQTLSSRLFSDKTVRAKTSSKKTLNQTTMPNQAISKEKVLEAKQYYNNGFRQYELGNIETALAQYNKALTIYPTLKKVHFQRSVVLIDLGSLEAAFLDIQQAVQEMPEDATVLLTAGWISLAINDLEAATNYLLKAWAEKEAAIASSIAINLGHVHLLKKEKAKAMNWYQRGRSASQDLPSFYKELKEDYQSLSVLNSQVNSIEYDTVLKQLSMN